MYTPELVSSKISLSDANSVWKNCLKKIKSDVSLMTYNTWFLPIKSLVIEDSTLRIQLPSQFF